MIQSNSSHHMTRRGFLRAAALLGGSSALLSGCGFQPVYGDHSRAAKGDVATDLAAVKIGIISNREGQILHNFLLDRFNPKGIAAKSLYKLDVGVSVASAATGVQIDATTARAQLYVYAKAALEVGEHTYQFSSNVVSGYSTSDDDYASEVARRTAIERSMRIIADDLRLQIATFFEKQRVKSG